MSVHGRAFQLPQDKRRVLTRAVRLEWISIVVMLSIVAVIGVAMGSSEAMKAVWIEDLLSLIPPIAFLTSVRFRDRHPTDEFPYGYRRASAIGFLVAAVTLLALGIYILIEAIATLILAQHPTIGTIGIFGQRLWLGWFMMAALVYSAIPPFILGRKKLILARELHDKTLQTDADLNKGDWLTGLAGVAGIVLIGFGYWWADAIAASVISFEILRDGVENLRNSVAQLMNKRPSDVSSKEKDPVLDKVEDRLRTLDWVRDVRVRLREDGDVVTGEAFVVPRDEIDLIGRVEQAGEAAAKVDWRVHDINVVPVRSIRRKVRRSFSAG
jgi:cation diffusion facilitator family transporter